MKTEQKMNSLLIRNGHIIDPANDIDEIGDVLIVNHKIAKVGGSCVENAGNVIDATGLTVTPGSN